MARNIIGGIALYLQGESHGTVGTDIFRGGLRPYAQVSGSDIIPRNAIFVSAPTPGLAPIPIAGTNWQKLRQVSIQVMLRRSSSSDATARSVFESLAAGISGYVMTEVVGSGPAYLGVDQNGDHLWSMNMIITYDETLTGGVGSAVVGLDEVA